MRNTLLVIIFFTTVFQFNQVVDSVCITTTACVDCNAQITTVKPVVTATTFTDSTTGGNVEVITRQPVSPHPPTIPETTACPTTEEMKG
jgi:hypothetical protein